ncbi:lipase family protein [Xylella fastidiosa subsp. multiplex]|uniref:lipase family protein n=1 Tax=Xylella fastidiosa TaxID=2371 RepID=UPI0023605D42|nr:lipase family protein [Xylella fastidiosa]MDD0936878.1 lipase family protein [Xylella fastidiosa subsp. multiplex]
MRYFKNKPVLPGLRTLILTSVLSPAVVAAWPQRGTLIESKVIASYKRDAIAAFLNDEPRYARYTQPKCDVQVLKLTYATVGVYGEPAMATGVLLIPDGPDCPRPYPILTWGPSISAQRHAGQDKAIVKANGNTPLVTRFASQGYVVVSTDYLGLGDSDYPFHPYFHVPSEVSATIDAVRAARHVLLLSNTPLSNKVMLSGFSQGAHAALAVQREIETHPSLSKEFSLAASAPISGPYALSQTILDSWSGRNEVGENPIIIPFASSLIIGMQRVYWNIYLSPTQVFQEPWASKVEARFPGDKQLTLDDFPKADQIKTYFQLEFYNDFQNNPKNSFRQNLVRNDLLDWTPHTPTWLCGSSNDSLVPIKNIDSAVTSFIRRGSTKVSAWDVEWDNDKPKITDGVVAHSASLDSCAIAVRIGLLDRQR